MNQHSVDGAGLRGDADAGWRKRGWPEPASIRRAAELIAAVLPMTPLVPMPGIPGGLHLKLETVQPTGSFKVRGALAAVHAYADEAGAVVTASAGNHGLGMAWAARLLGVDATIVVPETVSRAKVMALGAFGSLVETYGGSYDEAEARAKEIAANGARYVSAYNDPMVLAGQSTIVAEVAEQIEEPCTIIAPVGGGGLVSGLALGARLADRDIRVIGVEAEASRAVSASVSAGRVVRVDVAETIADGLVGNIETGAVTPEIVRFTGTELVAVGEPALREAMRALALQAGIYAEGAGAAGLAAVHDGRVPADGALVVLVTGRNSTPGTFARVLLDV